MNVIIVEFSLASSKNTNGMELTVTIFDPRFDLGARGGTDNSGPQ